MLAGWRLEEATGEECLPKEPSATVAKIFENTCERIYCLWTKKESIYRCFSKIETKVA